jgi:hypothetical protein
MRMIQRIVRKGSSSGIHRRRLKIGQYSGVRQWSIKGIDGGSEVMSD